MCDWIHRRGYGIGCLLLGLLLVSCSAPRQVNYRLTVQVLVDGQVRSGCGVIATDWFDQHGLAGLAQGAPWVVRVHGEAIPIDLGSRGTLWVLLTGPRVHAQGEPADQMFYSPDPQYVILRAFHMGGLSTVRLKDLDHLPRTPAPLRPDDLPVMAVLPDPQSPNGLRLLSSEPDIHVVGATLDITDAPMTQRIEGLLPWLHDLSAPPADWGSIPLRAFKT